MLEYGKLVKQIAQLKHNLEENAEFMTATQIKKATAKIAQLKHIADYLESKPTEEFVKSEIDRLRNRAELINEGFNGWLPVREFQNEKEKLKFYQKENGLPKLRVQLKALKFILNK